MYKRYINSIIIIIIIIIIYKKTGAPNEDIVQNHLT